MTIRVGDVRNELVPKPCEYDILTHPIVIPAKAGIPGLGAACICQNQLDTVLGVKNYSDVFRVLKSDEFHVQTCVRLISDRGVPSRAGANVYLEFEILTM